MNCDTFKKYFPVIVVGTVLVLINIFALVWYVLPAGPKQWEGDIIPGKVTLITESTLVTTDPRGNTKTFLITPETKFFAGRNIVTFTELTVNNIVLVQIDVATTTSMVAKEVRLMTDKRKEKKTP